MIEIKKIIHDISDGYVLSQKNAANLFHKIIRTLKDRTYNDATFYEWHISDTPLEKNHKGKKHEEQKH